MNSFIFVAVICMGTQCEFVASNKQVTAEQCTQVKQEFLKLPFKKEVTLAATQCMPFEDKVRV